MTDAAEPPAAAAPSQDRDAAAGGSSSGDGLQGEPTPEDPPRGDDAEDDNGGDGGEGTPAEPDQASLAWVTPVDELDNSDVEAAQVNMFSPFVAHVSAGVCERRVAWLARTVQTLLSCTAREGKIRSFPSSQHTTRIGSAGAQPCGLTV